MINANVFPCYLTKLSGTFKISYLDFGGYHLNLKKNEKRKN